MSVLLLVLSQSLSGCARLWDHALEQNRALSMAAGSVKAAASKAPIGIEEEKSYGDSIAVKVAERYGGLIEDPSLQHYVALVGNAVAFHSDRPSLRFRFRILRSEAVNATSAPGGWVFVTIRALRKMDSEAQLAGVLAHEVTHITLRHALPIIKNQKAAMAAAEGMTRGSDMGGFFKEVMDSYTNSYFENGMGAELEFESDVVGTKLLAKVGYDPRGLRDFLAKIAPKHQQKLDAQAKMFGQTHPDTHERIDRLDKLLATIKVSRPAHKERYAQGTRALTALTGEDHKRLQWRSEVALAKTIVKDKVQDTSLSAPTEASQTNAPAGAPPSTRPPDRPNK